LLWVACSGSGEDPDTEARDSEQEETAAKDSQDSQDSSRDTGEVNDAPPLLLDEAPKNLLFVAFDTTRLDRIRPDLAPQISAVLDESVVFRQHRACSNWTYLSFGCALTGRSNIAQEWVPEGHQTLKAEDGTKTPYPDAPRMMAERFAEEGFQTVLTGTHPLLNEEYNLFQGYERRETVLQGGADNVADKAAELAQAQVDVGEPWMMHVHFDDPHIPYTIREAYIPELDELPEMGIDFSMRNLQTFMISLWPKLDEGDKEDLLINLNAFYNGEIRFMDKQFGRLWSRLKSMGALEDTLVVLFSDHGEQFFEHDGFAHGATLHAEETRALFAFWHEDLPARKMGWRTANEDILPTVLQLMGLDLSDTDGLVLSQLEEAPSRPVFGVHAETPASTQQSVRSGDDYFIYWWSGFGKRYDLSKDPTEQTNLYGQDPQLDQSLMDMLASEIQALSLLHPENTPVPLD